MLPRNVIRKDHFSGPSFPDNFLNMLCYVNAAEIPPFNHFNFWYCNTDNNTDNNINFFVHIGHPNKPRGIQRGLRGLFTAAWASIKKKV